MKLGFASTRPLKSWRVNLQADHHFGEKPVRGAVCADPMKITRSIFTYFYNVHVSCGGFPAQQISILGVLAALFRALQRQERYQQLDDWINDPLNIPKAHATRVPEVGGKVQQPWL